MKARLYANGFVIGETEIRTETLETFGGRRHLAPADAVTVLFIEEHPGPESKKLFMHGRLETA